MSPKPVTEFQKLSQFAHRTEWDDGTINASDNGCKSHFSRASGLISKELGAVLADK
jgi:hypothetical protein